MKVKGLPLLIVFALVGCLSTASRDQAMLLGNNPDFEHMRSFQKLLTEQPGTPAYEAARVEYLMERLTQSPHQFVREKVAYSNMRAVMHLRWKYMRYHKDATTAEKFVHNIAFGSRKTGQPYYIRTSEGQVYFVDCILNNELAALDAKLKLMAGEAGAVQNRNIKEAEASFTAPNFENDRRNMPKGNIKDAGTSVDNQLNANKLNRA